VFESEKKTEGIYKFKGSLRRSVIQAKMLWNDSLIDEINSPEENDNSSLKHFMIRDSEFGDIHCHVESFSEQPSKETFNEEEAHLHCKLDSEDYWGSSLLYKVLSWLKSPDDFTAEHILGWGSCTREDNNLFIPKNLSKLDRKVVSDGIYHGIHIESEDYVFERNDLEKFSSYNYLICIHGKHKSHLFVFNNLIDKQLKKNQSIILELQPKKKLKAKAL
jgi:hypothetical protein